MVIRAFLSEAEKLVVVPQGGGLPTQPMTRIHPDGLFEAVLPGRHAASPFRPC